MGESEVIAMRAILLLSMFVFAGCSQSDDALQAPPRSGIEAGYAQHHDSASAEAASGLLTPLQPPQDPGPGAFLITTSGEKLALSGYAFTQGASLSSDPAFVDGWDVKFDEVIVTLDHITLSEAPFANPTNQAQTGKQVAHLDGPFAVDLHKGGPLQGKGGEGEQSVALGVIGDQNDNGGAGFGADSPYALGFDSVVASAHAWNVNLDEQGLADYQIAIAQGWSTLIVGTATYKGAEPPADSELAKLPPKVRFRFGFSIPATYANCQNPDNDPSEPFTGEEHVRGVHVKPNASALVQLTMHTDHTFWEKLSHEQPLHFDPIACAYVGVQDPVAQLSDMAKLDFTGFRCSDGNPLLPRSLVSDYAPVAGGILYFDPNGVSPLPTYKDYLEYSVSTQGHLNSDGLCAVKRHYPSPP
jgi:hypothetical protein